jgi:hypothetical protein
LGLSPFYGFPLIVECKHHDDLAQNPGRNIEHGWREVKRKLAAQAAEGWPGLYAPWKQARAYLYCISSRLPNQQARTELQQEIRDFFAALPDNQRPPIVSEQIRVSDWSDLQGWFNQNTLLCDNWLGIELPRVWHSQWWCRGFSGLGQRGARLRRQAAGGAGAVLGSGNREAGEAGGGRHRQAACAPAVDDCRPPSL